MVCVGIGRPFECLNQRLLIQPLNSFAWSERARTLNELDFLSQAIDNANLALLIDSEFGEAWEVKSYALKELGYEYEASEALDRARAAQSSIPMERGTEEDILGARIRGANA